MSEFSELLIRAGFRVQGQRADCAHCKGTARLTVSFNEQVAYCHRCHWRGNVRTLARKIGAAVAPESAEQRKARANRTVLLEWVSECERILSERLRKLGRQAEWAKAALSDFPDLESAWQALADFYHNDFEITEALNVLARLRKAAKHAA